MMLVNAVYFKGRWAAEFEPLLTQPRPFFIDGTTPENVMTMQRLGLYRYGELPHLEARYIELPYTVREIKITCFKQKMNENAESLFSFVP